MFAPVCFCCGRRSLVITYMMVVCGSCSPLPPSGKAPINGGTSTAVAAASASTNQPANASNVSAPVGSTSVGSTSFGSTSSGAAEASADIHEHRASNDGMGSVLERSSQIPEAVKPPFPNTALAEDGVWREFGREADGRTLMWRTELHPNARSRFVSVDVVAVDLRRFRLEWVVGVGDVGAPTLADQLTPGLVDGAWARDVVAVFNGGFQARHGYWGQTSHGVTLVKPRSDGCGIALYEDGRVVFGSSDLADQAGLVTYRQTPPCLVANGLMNPRLSSGQDGIWAGTGTKEKTRRRSAAGLSADRQTLFYLVGVETAPADLARALEALGVEYGLQLDINWNWTRFFLVETAADASASLSAPLISGMVADKGEYLRRPSKRDFFAIVRRRAEQ